MPRVTVVTTTPPPLRFDGDFRIESDQNQTGTADSAAAIAAVNDVLTHLAAEEVQDLAANYPGAFLAARQKIRRATAQDLRATVEQFAADAALTAEFVRERTDVIQKKHQTCVPKFGAADLTQPRFGNDFHVAIASGYDPTAEEKVYLETLRVALDELATDELKDPKANFSPILLAARKTQRSEAASRLRSTADRLSNGDTSTRSAADDVLLNLGMYRALRDRMTRRLFNVALMNEEEHKKGESLAVDLRIRLIGGLPAPEDVAPPDKQELFVQINKTGTVFRTVCQRTIDSAQAGQTGDGEAAKGAKRLLDEYMSKLQGIAVIGLEYPHTALAQLALNELRNEFVAREAGRVKNKYLRWLGLWAGIAALVFFAIYTVIVWAGSSDWMRQHKNFLLAGAGAAIGTWVSFSVRQVQLSFDDLLMLEEDALDPPLRVLFVVGMTLTACLLFWTGAINLEIGNLKTKQEAFGSIGSVALLVGMFAGLSERALATAISGRAAAFVKGIGGG